MPGRGFVTAGTWCVDRNITVPSWPREDRATHVLDVAVRGGGSGCNFAVDMRTLDGEIPVDTFGLVGADADGDFLVGVACEHGIGHAGLIQSAVGETQRTDAFQSQDSGLRTHILYENLARDLTPDHLDFSRSTGRRMVHLGLPGVHARMDVPWGDAANGWVAALRQARAAGLATNMELVTVAPDRIRAIVTPCLPYLTTLVVNEVEIGALAESETTANGETDEAAVRRAAAAVLEKGGMEAVVVHYVTGAIALARDGAFTCKGSVLVPREAIQGPNGAGDAFAAGFLYGWHEGWPMAQRLAMAHAAAAVSLRAVGTYDALAPWRECLALADGWGWR